MSSTKVTLTLPTEAAQRLARMHEAGELRGLPVLELVTEVKLEDPRDASMRRIEGLVGEARGQAMMRASCSYSSPATATRVHGCAIDLVTNEVVWPDGERWPMRPDAMRDFIDTEGPLDKSLLDACGIKEEKSR